MGENFLCIHGHFYQPPRENPWLQVVELESSALPFHDWNHKITRECYAPNAWARIHTSNGRILRLMNNFGLISFDMGPTLISWIEGEYPELYEKILEADRIAQLRFDGHGSAMAQVYNHIIMPLANHRDKLTQVRWGVRDFEHRFKRRPEGMWLSETAVDTETLEVLAEAGIRFTILSPFQAMKIRPIGAGKAGWKEVLGGLIDISQPYRIFLPSGRHIDCLFYHAGLSKAIAFEGALASGENVLKEASLALFKKGGENPIVCIATDGESYGHHFKFGDLALAWMLEHSKEMNLTLTVPGQYLERFPPKWEVVLVEPSSWSCAHGVRRWEEDCGCSLSQRPEWNQRWRRPLRDGLNWLRDRCAEIFEREVGRVIKDPWLLRDQYVELLLTHGIGEGETWQALMGLEPPQRSMVLRLLEAQRMCLFMFTSCAWFFDDIAGLEAVQVMKYALRAIELCGPYSEIDLLKGLLLYLSRARPNDPRFQDGAEVFDRLVRPHGYGYRDIAAIQCLYRLFGLSFQQSQQFGLKIEEEFLMEEGNLKAALGKVHIRLWPWEEYRCIYAGMIEETGLFIGIAEADEVLELRKILKKLEGIKFNKKELVDILQNETKGMITYDTKKIPLDVYVDLSKRLAERITTAKDDSYSNAYILTLLIKNLKNSANLKNAIDITPHGIKSLLNKLICEAVINFFKTAELKVGDINLRLSVIKSFKKLIVQDIMNQIDTARVQEFLKVNIQQFKITKAKSYLKKLYTFLLINNILELKIDLFFLQSFWYDMFNDKSFISQLRKDILVLFMKIGDLIGFEIGPEKKPDGGKDGV